MAGSARGGCAAAAIELSVLWLPVAIAAPEALVAGYDASPTGWLDIGNPPVASPIGRPAEAPLPVPSEFWPAFWSLVADPQAGRTHPAAGDVLAAIGQRHPDKTTAKHARAAVVRHRSHLANQRN